MKGLLVSLLSLPFFLLSSPAFAHDLPEMHEKYNGKEIACIHQYYTKGNALYHLHVCNIDKNPNADILKGYFVTGIFIDENSRILRETHDPKASFIGIDKDGDGRFFESKGEFTIIPREGSKKELKNNDETEF